MGRYLRRHLRKKSHLSSSSSLAGSAAAKAEERKRLKYHSLEKQSIFVPIGVETMGSLGPEASSFINAIGKRLIANTGEKRASEYLKQRISIAIQRGNIASILATVPSSRSLGEIFYLL